MKHLILLSLVFLSLAVTAAPVRLGVPISSSEKPDHALDDARRAGMSIVTIRAEWPRIQPTAKTWDFAWLDTLVDRAKASKMSVVLVCGPAPGWAVSYLRNPTPAELSRARPDLPAYTRYVTEVAKRYNGRVTFYQPWDRPTGDNLLATSAQTWKLYRAAAAAVHGVEPALRVIAPEPGDVKLGWIYDYLRGSRGLERPDVLLLSAASDRATPDALARRLNMLRARALPAPPPALWASVPAATELDWGWSAAATFLLQNVSTLLLQPAAPYRDICAKPVFFGELQSLAALSGQDYLGWQRVGPALAGVYGNGKAQCAVILPDAPAAADAALRLLPAQAAVNYAIAVPAQKMGVKRLSGTSQQIDVRRETAFPLTSRPVILTGVLLKPTAGTLSRTFTPLKCASVSLDPTGTDPHALRPLATLSGGKYTEIVTAGRLAALQTIRDKQPWIHLDVPDDFLFFNIDRRPVQVTVRVRGVAQPRKTGFLLYYDALGSMANSPWQWIDAGPGKEFTYTFRLPNALFANSEGYDLRLDMGGSTENIQLLDMKISK